MIELQAYFPSYASLYDQAKRIAVTESRVWIQGETGSGKTTLAKQIHAWSDRAKGPCIELPCANINESLAESLLFGHVQGAFTGAVSDQPGFIRAAEGGTLILDGAEHLPATVQAKLLRALQEEAVHPLGQPSPVAINVRWITLSSPSTKTLIREDQLRADLFFRLGAITLEIPPIREHSEPLKRLLPALLQDKLEQLGASKKSLSDDALNRLLEHSWPGNFSEVQRTLEAAILLSDGETITPNDLPEHLNFDPDRALDSSEKLSLTLDELERRYILAVLDQCQGNKSEAARRLGIHRKTLHQKLNQWDDT